MRSCAPTRKVPAGAHRLGVHVERLVRDEPPAKGARTGVSEYTLLIDGEPAGTLQTQLGFHTLISWSGLDIGRDRGSPVSHYDAPFEFTGKLLQGHRRRCITTRSSTARASATRRWRGSEGCSCSAGDAKHRTMVRNCAPENLEIPGSLFARPGMTSSLDLLVGRREVGQRHRDRDGFLVQVLESDLELLAGFQRREKLRRDRRIGIAAAVLAGLDLQIDRPCRRRPGVWRRPAD